MLTRVHFAGIKSLLDVTLNLDRFTVLVGPNGCGKSTLLDQVELVTIATTANTRTQNIFGSVGDALEAEGLGELRTADRDLPLVIEASDDRGRQVSLHIQKSPEFQWAGGTQVEATSAEGTLSLSYESKPGERIAFQSHLAQGFDWRAQRLALNPTAISAPSPVQTEILSPSGYGLPTILKDLAGNDTAAFLRLQEDLRQVVPHFRELRFGKGRDRAEGPVVTLELVMQQGRIPAHRASDGTLLALALLAATHNSDLPRLLLMDDLDHGLHLSAQIAMVEAIRRVMQTRTDLQVICTSHSPVLLDSFQVAEVRVVALDAQGYTRVRSLADHPPLDPWRASMSTGELWANLGEGWVVDA